MGNNDEGGSSEVLAWYTLELSGFHTFIHGLVYFHLVYFCVYMLYVTANRLETKRSKASRTHSSEGSVRLWEHSSNKTGPPKLCPADWPSPRSTFQKPTQGSCLLFLTHFQVPDPGSSAGILAASCKSPNAIEMQWISNPYFWEKKKRKEKTITLASLLLGNYSLFK